MTTPDAPQAFQRGQDYLALPRDPQPWIIEKLLPLGGLTNLYGTPKAGKSFAALGIAHAVADPMCEEWLGFKVRKHGRVAYLQVDTPRSEWGRRLDQIVRNGYDLSDVYFADKIIAPYPFNILEPSHGDWLHKQIAAVDPMLVIVDTLREVHGGDENDSTVMRNVIANLVKACGEHRAILLVSHSRKGLAGATRNLGEGDDSNDLMNDNRGSGYVPGRMDSVVKLTPRTLTFKGRATDQGSLRVQQAHATGLLERPNEDSKVDQTLLKMFKDRTPEDTVNSLATRAVEELGKGTIGHSTVRKRFTEMFRQALPEAA